MQRNIQEGQINSNGNENGSHYYLKTNTSITNIEYVWSSLGINDMTEYVLGIWLMNPII